MLSALTMCSQCVYWVYGPLSPVTAVFQSIPRRVAGQPFQQWLALTRTARGLPVGDSSGVDVSVSDVVELDAGVIGVGHRSGPGVVGDDVHNVAVPGPSSSVDSRVGGEIGGSNGQPGTRSSQRRRVPRS